MKSITLTQAHKSKLLEMCKILFPEYEIICNHQDLENKVFINHTLGCGFLRYPHSINELWVLHKKKDEFHVIHWFEFCMTHLAEKILDNTRGYDEGNFPSELEMFRGTICYKLNIDAFKNEDSENHPVDYLYNEFKKLKL